MPQDELRSLYVLLRYLDAVKREHYIDMTKFRDEANIFVEQMESNFHSGLHMEAMIKSIRSIMQ